MDWVLDPVDDVELVRDIERVRSVGTGKKTSQFRIRSDEQLMFETSAFESLYGGQFTLSTQLVKPNYLLILPTDAAPQFL